MGNVESRVGERGLEYDKPMAKAVEEIGKIVDDVSPLLSSPTRSLIKKALVSVLEKYAYAEQNHE